MRNHKTGAYFGKKVIKLKRYVCILYSSSISFARALADAEVKNS